MAGHIPLHNELPIPVLLVWLLAILSQDPQGVHPQHTVCFPLYAALCMAASRRRQQVEEGRGWTHTGTHQHATHAQFKC